MNNLIMIIEMVIQTRRGFQLLCVCMFFSLRIGRKERERESSGVCTFSIDHLDDFNQVVSQIFVFHYSNIIHRH